MRNQLNELGFTPVPVPPERSRSAIEARYPHIARELSALWQTGQIELYLDSLLIDTRGGRQGFPADVLDELMFLSGMRWHLNHTGKVQDFQKPDLFSFAATNEDDLRRCGTTGGWILV